MPDCGIAVPGRLRALRRALLNDGDHQVRGITDSCTVRLSAGRSTDDDEEEEEGRRG